MRPAAYRLRASHKHRLLHSRGSYSTFRNGVALIYRCVCFQTRPDTFVESGHAMPWPLDGSTSAAIWNERWLQVAGVLVLLLLLLPLPSADLALGLPGQWHWSHWR